MPAEARSLIETRPMRRTSLIVELIRGIVVGHRHLAFFEVAQDLEEGADIVGWLGLLRFRRRSAAQLTQMLQVDRRPGAGDFAQDLFIFQQAGAQALQAVEAGILGGRFAAQHGQAGADRGVVLVAQQFAEVLDLAAAGTVRRDALAVTDGAQDVLRQIDALELADGQLNQFGAQVAQLVHGLLLLGFGGAAGMFGEIFFLHGARTGEAIVGCSDSDFPVLTPFPCPIPLRFPIPMPTCSNWPRMCSATLRSRARRPARSMCRKASGSPSRCAAMRSRPSSSTATRAWASRSTPVSAKAMRAPPIFRRRPCGIRSKRR